MLLKRRNEKLKLRWRILKKHFKKVKSISILAVEVVQDDTIVSVSKQFQVEASVIGKNSKRFVLAYSLLLLKVGTLQKLDLKGEKAACQELINSGVMIPGILSDLASFLSLMYQPNKELILIKVLL